MNPCSARLSAGFLAAALCTFLLLAPGPALARPVGLALARNVALNWLAWAAYQDREREAPAGQSVDQGEPVLHQGRTVAFSFRVVPEGQVLVPDSDELSPVLLASDQVHFPLDQTPPSPSAREGEALSAAPAADPAARDPLPEASAPGTRTGSGSREPAGFQEASAWLRALAVLSVSAAEDPLTFLPRRDQALRQEVQNQWALLGQDPTWFKASLPQFEARHGMARTDPLLASAWTQDAPFNEKGPVLENGCRAPAGSTAVALAQVLRLHGHPAQGRGTVSYQSVGGRSRYTLSRNLGDSRYDWTDMPEALDPSWSESARETVADLVADVGLALRTNYACQHSEASLEAGPQALIDHFGYRPVLRLLDRADSGTGLEWFSALRAEVEAGRPVPLRVEIRDGPAFTVAVDGFREGLPMVHANTGLGPRTGVWLSPDLLLAGSPALPGARQTALAGLEPPRLVPRLLTPAAGATVLEAAPLFSWRSAEDGDPSHYNLWVGRGTEAASDDWVEARAACEAGVCQARPGTPLSAAGEYSWAVRGGSQSAGGGPWSEVRPFLALPPPPPQALAPRGVLANTTLVFAWKEVNGSTAYRLRVETPEGSVAHDEWHRADRLCGTRNCSLPLAGLPPGPGTWTVRALGVEEGPACAPVAFEIPSRGPAAPRLLTPGPQRIWVAPAVRYRWTETGNATSYHLFVSEPPGAAILDIWYEAAHFCASGVCSAEPTTPLAHNRTFHWKVRGVGPLGPGLWSPEGNFTFSPTPAPGPGRRFTPPKTAPVAAPPAVQGSLEQAPPATQARPGPERQGLQARPTAPDTGPDTGPPAMTAQGPAPPFLPDEDA